MVMLVKYAINLVFARPSGGQVASGRVRSTKNFALHGGHMFSTFKTFSVAILYSQRLLELLPRNEDPTAPVPSDSINQISRSTIRKT